MKNTQRVATATFKNYLKCAGAFCLGQYYDLRESNKNSQEREREADSKQRFLCLTSLKNITALWRQRQFLAGARQGQQSAHLAD